MENKSSIKYYRRKSGTYVRVIDGVILQYLNPECNWIYNQEWFASMFIDGEDEYVPCTEKEVDSYIKACLNSNLSMKTLKK